jgi:ABC-type sugar transport system ATPase subunit
MQIKGKVTYNGHEMTEFVPERTAAYISQYDLHIGEMTVRETLAFSARCQGVGSRLGMILCSHSFFFFAESTISHSFECHYNTHTHAGFVCSHLDAYQLLPLSFYVVRYAD